MAKRKEEGFLERRARDEEQEIARRKKRKRRCVIIHVNYGKLPKTCTVDRLDATFIPSFQLASDSFLLFINFHFG